MSDSRLENVVEDMKDGYSSFHRVVVRDFGYYRECENRLAEALERSVKPLRDTGDFTMASAVAAEETAERVECIAKPGLKTAHELKWLFNIPKVAPSLKVILRLPHIKVIPSGKQ